MISKISSNKYFLPYDVYERHKKVASFIEKSDRVLDVGGELNHLAQFCSQKKIVVANLEGGDVIIGGDKLPFKNNQFTIVCAIDVLEHIAKEKRSQFVKELVRVASKKIILSFPVGTPSHVQYEKGLQAHLKAGNQDVEYLQEHIKFGLPTMSEVKKLTKGLSAKIEYSGNLKILRLLFKLHLFDPRIKLIRGLFYFAKLTFYFLANPILYYLLTGRKYSQSVVRAYVLIAKPAR